MSHNNAYFQCRKHGNVYVMRDVTLYSTMDFRNLEPMIEGIDPPDPGDNVVCPLCGGDYRIFFGD